MMTSVRHDDVIIMGSSYRPHESVGYDKQSYSDNHEIITIEFKLGRVGEMGCVYICSPASFHLCDDYDRKEKV